MDGHGRKIAVKTVIIIGSAPMSHPVTESGQVVGYESVRTCPERADIARAEKLYARDES